MLYSWNSAGIAWRPGSWQHAPWLAFTCILSFALCCAALVALLLNSDNREVAAWPSASAAIPVSVFLAFAVGIANLCLTIALGKGFEVSWWAQALQGAELRKLHFDLDVQHRISAILSKKLSLDEFVIAAVVSLLVSVLDSPLIQRASTISTRRFGPSLLHVGVDISNASLPDNFSDFGEGKIGFDLLTPLFRNVSRGYGDRADITLPMRECQENATCIFTLPAPGFDVSCAEDVIPYNFSNLSAAGNGDQIIKPSSIWWDDDQLTTFDITVSFGGDDDLTFSTINTTTLYKADPACEGHITKQECVLRLATVGYPVTVSDGLAALESWQPGQNETLEMVQISSPDRFGIGSIEGAFQTMLGGIFSVTDQLYSSHVALKLEEQTSVPFVFNITGQAGNNYLTSDVSTYGFCNMTWEDPTTDVVNTVRELMLRSAIAYSNYNSSAVAPQQLSAQQYRFSSAYKSHYDYLIATLACMVLQALIITFLLSRWRHIGRDMSLDPLEIARALGAPLLQGGSSNAGIQETLSPLQHHRLRFGEVLPGAWEVQISGGNVENNVGPTSKDYSQNEVMQLLGSKHKYELQAPCVQRPRLGLDRAERIKDIQTGLLYY